MHSVTVQKLAKYKLIHMEESLVNSEKNIKFHNLLISCFKTAAKM